MFKLREDFEDIIKGYGFHAAQTLDKLLVETANMFYLIYSSYVDVYKRVSNKIWVYDEVIPDILEICKEDLKDDYFYLYNLVKCIKECYNISTDTDVLLLLQPQMQSTLEEWDCVFVQSVADVINILEVVDDKLMLPEKWCSPKLYKQVGEFLKTFGCVRCKVKKRVGYQNKGEFTNEQIIHIGKQLNGVSLSEKFDFYPTPDELVERVQELADIKDKETILEPSAGTGSLLKGLNKTYITCIEINEVLATILQEKGYNVYNCAFEDFVFADAKYDKIIMNPPFGKRLDAKHIVRAFNEFLQDGGTLVAIHSTGIKSSTDKYSKEFQKLYEKYGVLQEDYTNNEFKNSGKGTNVATTISKFVKVKI